MEAHFGKRIREKMSPTLLGVISDTHGLWRPQICEIFAGVDQIIHAGDIGKASTLAELERIAPVTAVRGNCDSGLWSEGLRLSDEVETEGGRLYVLHDVKDLDFSPASRGYRCVIYGHSHKPGFREEDGVLYLNPGSAGPRRFRLPITVALLRVERGRMEPELVTLAG